MLICMLVGNNPVLFVDPWGLCVSVFYRPLKGGAFGLGYHQAISVNGEIYGFSKDVGVIQENSDDYGWGSHEKVIYPGNEQDQTFLNHLQNTAKGNDPRFTKDNYGLCTNNCMTFANTVLNEAPRQNNSFNTSYSYKNK